MSTFDWLKLRKAICKPTEEVKWKKLKYVKLDHAFKKSLVYDVYVNLKNVFNNQGYKVR